MGGVDKRNTGALPQIPHFKEDSLRNTDLSLEFYKSIVGLGGGKSIFIRVWTKRNGNALDLEKKRYRRG